MSLPRCPECNKVVLTTYHHCTVTNEVALFSSDIVSVFGNPTQGTQEQEHLAVKFTVEEYTAPSWPLFITGISWLRTKDDKGIGDTVKHALSYMGGTQFEWVMKRLGVDCGCGSRQAWLNAKYPY